MNKEEKNTFLSPIQKFIKAESFSGVLLFVSMVLALVLSNSPIREYFSAIWDYKVGITSDNFELVKPLILWINDGLMAIFFFLIGLEIKREILLGELNSLKKAALPIFAAIGGMLIPLSLFLVLNNNSETINGWGIPMATDIAFTLAILKLLGNKVPLSLKIFLTAFAIIDDIGAVLVIAIFYTADISWILLLFAGILFSVLYVLSYLRIYNKAVLLIFGFTIWLLFLKSGVHPTVAGILLAFAVPIRQRISEFRYAQKLENILKRLTASNNTNKLPVLSKSQIAEIDNLEEWTNKVQSPLQHLEHRLHYWVAFLIMPIFALSNAGVYVSSDMVVDFSFALNIAASLFIGKALGVSLFSYLSIKLKLAELPKQTTFIDIIGVAILSGVGFTMSLFIGGLAFNNNDVFMNSAKIGIIVGSVVSGVVGYIVLRWSILRKESLQQ
ncbi:Na+/H+ antiporter NhaA [Flavobacteriales bacterium]|jgi:NhaA family Na+:H+ antiporter|nr:Na+/H+ antiporter NhaA [Flavobacteriales bacterium]